MPDIDIDFDDEGRVKVWTMSLKNTALIKWHKLSPMVPWPQPSIQDTARVLDLPLGDADRIAKLVPNMSKLNFWALKIRYCVKSFEQIWK